MSNTNAGDRLKNGRWVGSMPFNRRKLLRGTLGAAALAIPSVRAADAQESATTVIAVFPSPGCQAASPRTEISFRGALSDDLGPIAVSASRTGVHAGVLRPHADGGGVSFLPDFPFEPGEAVTVRTELDILNGSGGVTRFVVAEALYLDAGPAKNDPPDPEQTRTFRSRPDLAPPRIEVTVAVEGTAPGYLFLAPKRGAGQNVAMIMDSQGEPVWIYTPEIETEQMFDFRVQTYQDRPVLTWWQGIGGGRHGWGHWVVLDDAYEEIALIQAGNGYDGADIHEFTLTSRGTALVNIYNTILWDTTSIGGSEDQPTVDGIVQEIEIATGRVVFEWHSVDHIALDESYQELTDEERDLGYDYFHVNSATEADDGSLIINARHPWATYKLDRASGEVIWRLGGKQNDFDMGDGAQPAFQHDARLWPNGELSLFDNADPEAEGAHSRGLVLALDTDAMTAAVAREYAHPEGLLSESQGNMQILPNGNVLIGWGSEPWLTEFSQDGEVLFDAQILSEKHSYRAYRFEWTGAPRTPPDIAAERSESGGLTLYASWNGATELAAWQALTGSSEDALEPAGDPVTRAGFETQLTVDSDAAVVAVAALDANGAELGRSAAVQP